MFEGIAKVMADEPNLGEYFLTDAFQYMIDHGSRIFTAEVAGWWDCGKPETLLSTNREMLHRFGVPEAAGGTSGGATLHEPVGIGANVTLEGSVLGPNVSVADGSVIRRSRLSDCIVGESARIEDCELRESIVGDHVTLRGVAGSVNVGDHSEVVVGKEE
jgi:glucose-1-phosphate thymidylyltransferase